jgi:hypothetical protein
MKDIFGTCVAMHHVALVSHPPLQFMPPPCCYHQLKDRENYHVWVTSIAIQRIRNFVKDETLLSKFEVDAEHTESQCHLPFFILGFFILLRVLYQGYQEKIVLRNNCSRRLLYFIPRSLHVSAFTGHHQVVHTHTHTHTHNIIYKKVIILTTDPLSVVQIMFVHVV